MIQGKMLGRLLSLLVDEDNHRVSQKAASPSGWAGEGLEQMVVTVLVLFLIVAADCWAGPAAVSLTLASWCPCTLCY